MSEANFLVQINRNEVKNNEPHKFDEIAWFKWGEFPKPRHSQFPKFFEEHKEKIQKMLGL